MNTTLWISQAVLALAFLLAGFMMVFQPIERLKKRDALGDALLLYMLCGSWA